MENLTDNTTTTKHKFILFVSGMSVKSGHAIENLHTICETYFADNYEVEIIDISHHKELAKTYEIIAIPTLIKINPLPKKIIVGDLSVNEKVLRILNITK